MRIYKHVLVAVDLHAECDTRVIERAMAIAKMNGAKISLIHAIEHINAYGVAEAYSAVLDVEAQIVEEDKKALAALGEKYGVAPTELYLEIGSPKSVILNKAKELQVDLILVGSHGRHGLQLLLGSTANAVLHHAECDVLAVRVKEK